MGLFKTSCHKCGTEIVKSADTTEKRFGKYFCCEEEADEFVDAVNAHRAAQASKQGSKGGCC